MDNIIKRIDFDFSDLPQDGELRNFTVVGSNDAEFRLEIKNEDNYYYNFVTNLFSSGRSDLKGVIKNGSYKTFVVKDYKLFYKRKILCYLVIMI